MYKNLVMIDTCSPHPIPPQKKPGRETTLAFPPPKKGAQKRRKSVLGHRAWKPSKEEEGEESGLFFVFFVFFGSEFGKEGGHGMAWVWGRKSDDAIDGFD